MEHGARLQAVQLQRGTKVQSMNTPRHVTRPAPSNAPPAEAGTGAGGDPHLPPGASNDTAFAPPETGRERARRNRILLLTGAGLSAAVAVLYYSSRTGSDVHFEAPAPAVQAVSAITVEARPLQQTITLGGEVRPVRDLQVAAPATGVRILKILVDAGDDVTEGQIMATLDTDFSDAQLQAAEAAVAEAVAEAVRARGEYARADSIRDSGALSEEAIEQRRAAALAADARLAAAQAQRADVIARFAGGSVRAPAAGRVIDRRAELGQPVDGQVLFRIAAGNQLEVAAEVAEAEALSLRMGQTANFVLVDGSSVQGVLRRLPASIDSETRTGQALFNLPEGTRVTAGMYLRGEVVLAAEDVMALPQDSILYEAGGAYVLMIDAAGHVHRTPVRLGRRDGAWIEITDGISRGQRIVGPGAAFLQDGEKVRVLGAAQAEPDAAAPLPPGTAGAAGNPPGEE